MRGVILGGNEDLSEVCQVLIRHHFGNKALAESPPVGSASALFELLTGGAHSFLLIPLTLPYAHSLLAARLAHRYRSATRIILLTASSASRVTLLGLFDVVLASPASMEEILNAVRPDGPRIRERITDLTELDRRTRRVIAKASCFDSESTPQNELADFKALWAEQLGEHRL